MKRNWHRGGTSLLNASQHYKLLDSVELKVIESDFYSFDILKLVLEEIEFQLLVRNFICSCIHILHISAIKIDQSNSRQLTHTLLHYYYYRVFCNNLMLTQKKFGFCSTSQIEW